MSHKSQYLGGGVPYGVWCRPAGAPAVDLGAGVGCDTCRRVTAPPLLVTAGYTECDMWGAPWDTDLVKAPVLLLCGTSGLVVSSRLNVGVES